MRRKEDLIMGRIKSGAKGGAQVTKDSKRMGMNRVNWEERPRAGTGPVPGLSHCATLDPDLAMEGASRLAIFVITDILFLENGHCLKPGRKCK